MDDSRRPPGSTPGSPMRSETDRQIASLIARLLSHFWATGEPESLRREQAHDWLDDLREYGPETVSRACGEWRRMQSRRPTIADIRKLCVEYREMYKPEQKYRSRLTGPLDWINAREAYAKSIGFPSWLAREDAIEARQEAYRKAEAWRQAGGLDQPQGTMRPAAALGVKAREYTPEELAKGRRELGIEDV